MFSPKLKYFLYGSLASASLITVIAQATSSDGVFGDYFQNIITDAVGCGTNTAITGFKTSPYGTQECTTFQNIVNTALKTFGSAPTGQAVIGFNSTTGAPIYGSLYWNSTGFAVSYNGFNNIGIGTTTPNAKLEVAGNIIAHNPTVANHVATKAYVDAHTSTFPGAGHDCPAGQFVSGFDAAGNIKCTGPSYIYNWSPGSYGACSKSCGGGTQTRVITCKRSDNITVADSYCSGAKPATSQSCNTQACAISLDTFEGCGMYCGYSPNEGHYQLNGTLSATDLNLIVTHICRYPSKCGGTATFSKSITTPIGNNISGNFNDLHGGSKHAWRYKDNCLYIYRDGDWNHRVGCF